MRDIGPGAKDCSYTEPRLNIVPQSWVQGEKDLKYAYFHSPVWPWQLFCSVACRWDPVSDVCTAADVQYWTHVGSYKSACGFCNWCGAAFVTEVLLLEQAIREPLNPETNVEEELQALWSMNEASHRTALFDWREKEPGFARTKMADTAPRSYKDEEVPPAGRGRKICWPVRNAVLENCFWGQVQVPLRGTIMGKKEELTSWEFSFVLYFYRKNGRPD